MKNHRRGISLVLAMLIALLSFGFQITSAGAEDYVPPYILDLFNDTALDLTQYWGKAYLLFFFMESSSDCLVQIPELIRIRESYSTEELQVIMIHEWANETDLNTLSVISQFGLDKVAGISFFEDKDMGVAKKINLPACPMTFFITQDGFLMDAYVYGIGYDMMAEVLDAMGISRALPATPAPEAVVEEAEVAVEETEEVEASAVIQ